MRHVYEVVIVGGGPAGATLAALLCRANVSVAVVERSSFPRYHIGESLIPQVLDTLEASGALPAVEAAGFLRKEGGVFRWGASADPWTVYFDELPEQYGRPYAYQVDRARFDDILLRHAASSGADVIQGWTATAVEQAGDRWLLKVRKGDEVISLCSDLVIDCSGQAAWTAHRLGLRRFDDVLSNLALVAYFHGAKRLLGRNANSILCEAIDSGWMWCIPLSDGTTSVGFVTRARRMQQQERRTAFAEALAQTHQIGRLLREAQQCSAVRVFADFSYRSQRLVTPGVIVVGDAGNFLDPVWSTGVFLATEGARIAAKSIVEWRRSRDDGVLREYEARIRQIVDAYHAFITYFYKSNLEPEAYFWKAFQLVDTAVDHRNAFIRLISGRLSADGEHSQKKPVGVIG